MKPMSFSPNIKSFRNTTGAQYTEAFKALRNKAIALDGTPEDRDSRKGFVEFPDNIDGRDRTLATIWGESGKENAQITILSGSFETETTGDGASVSTQKDRYIEMQNVGDRGLLEVSDRLTQSVDKSNERYDETLFNDHQETNIIADMNTGEVITDNYGDSNLLLNSGWSVAEFREKRAELG